MSLWIAQPRSQTRQRVRQATFPRPPLKSLNDVPTCRSPVCVQGLRVPIARGLPVAGTPSNWLRPFELHVSPTLGSRRVSDIHSRDILAVLVPLSGRAPATATRLRQRIAVVMGWAIGAGYRTDNPADLWAQLPRPRADHVPYRSLPYTAVAGAVATLRRSDAYAATKLAFEFLVLTATAPSRFAVPVGTRWISKLERGRCRTSASGRGAHSVYLSPCAHVRSSPRPAGFLPLVVWSFHLWPDACFRALRYRAFCAGTASLPCPMVSAGRSAIGARPTESLSTLSRRVSRITFPGSTSSMVRDRISMLPESRSWKIGVATWPNRHDLAPVVR